jgi:hypothetical protein
MSKTSSISVAEGAKLLGLSRQRVVLLCQKRRIPGAKLLGRMWFLPNPPIVSPGVMGRPRKPSKP